MNKIYTFEGKKMPSNVHPAVEGGKVIGYFITEPKENGDWIVSEYESSSMPTFAEALAAKGPITEVTELPGYGTHGQVVFNKRDRQLYRFEERQGRPVWVKAVPTNL